MTMRLRTLGLTAAVAAALMVGCASKPEVADCTYPDTPEHEAPAWICDAPVDGVEVSAVGSFRATKAGTQFQKTQATAAARNQLAAQMKVHVKRLVKNYVETTGVGDDETVDAVTSDVSKQITNETLHGTKVFRSKVNPHSKVMYVLVGMDPNAAAANSQEALKTSYNNQKAMWQKFMAKKAHADLDAEIDKMAGM